MNTVFPCVSGTRFEPRLSRPFGLAAKSQRHPKTGLFGCKQPKLPCFRDGGSKLDGVSLLVHGLRPWLLTFNPSGVGGLKMVHFFSWF
jgi:hypothetical protein